MNALEIKNLTKSFDDFKLDNLNLTLPGGCIMGLIGENGAGKSTVIKLILDIIHKDGGSITILGKNNEENINITKEDVGVVLDEVGIPECLNTEQVGKIMRYTFKNWNDKEYDKIIKKLSLPKNKPFGEFSRGMKMKLGIAIAMSHNSKLLLLDEATNGLDPVVRDEVIDMFIDYTRDENHSILISSHIVSDLEKICDYIAFLHKGKLLLCEEKDRLLSEYCMIHYSIDQADRPDDKYIKFKKISPYGIEAVIKRNMVPHGMSVSPVSIEELFVFMVKGDGE